MTISELRELVGLHSNEGPTKKIQLSKVKHDKKDINSLIEGVEKTCNSFSIASSSELCNLSPGKAAQDATREYLLGTLKREKVMRQLFETMFG